MAWRQTVDQCLGLADIAGLSGCADEAYGIAKRFDGGVDLGCQAALGPAQALGIRPPFSLRAPAAWLCARMIVLSRLWESPIVKSLPQPRVISRQAESSAGSQITANKR
jgi:hypothetical protein